MKKFYLILIYFFWAVAHAGDFGVEYSPTQVICSMSERPSRHTFGKMELIKTGSHQNYAEFDFTYQDRPNAEIVKMRIKTTDFRIRIGRLTGKLFQMYLLGEGVWKGAKTKVEFILRQDSAYSHLKIQNYISTGVVCNFDVPSLKEEDRNLQTPGLAFYSVRKQMNRTLDIWPLQKRNETLRMMLQTDSNYWAPNFEITSDQGAKRNLEPVLEDRNGTLKPRSWLPFGKLLLEEENQFLATGDSHLYFWRISDGKLTDQVEINQINEAKMISLRQILGFDAKKGLYWLTAESYGGGHYMLISLDKDTKAVASSLELSNRQIHSVLAIKEINGAKRILARKSNRNLVILDDRGAQLFEISNVGVVIAPDKEDIFCVISGADDYNSEGRITAYDLNLNIIWTQSIQMYTTSGGVSLADHEIVVAGQTSPIKNRVLSFNLADGKPSSDLASIDILRLFNDFSDAWVNPENGSIPLSFFIKHLGPNKIFTSSSYLTDSNSKYSVEKIWSLDK